MTGALVAFHHEVSFRHSQVSTLSDPFPFKPREPQHSFFESLLHWKSGAGWKEKTKETAKETMQARMVGKIPLRNETKVLQKTKSPLPTTNVKTGASNFDTG